MSFVKFTKTRKSVPKAAPVFVVRAKAKGPGKTKPMTAFINSSGARLLGWKAGKKYDVFVNDAEGLVGIEIRSDGELTCGEPQSARLGYAVEFLGGGEGEYRLEQSQDPSFKGLVARVTKPAPIANEPAAADVQDSDKIGGPLNGHAPPPAVDADQLAAAILEANSIQHEEPAAAPTREELKKEFQKLWDTRPTWIGAITVLAKATGKSPAWFQNRYAASYGTFPTAEDIELLRKGLSELKEPERPPKKQAEVKVEAPPPPAPKEEPVTAPPKPKPASGERTIVFKPEAAHRAIVLMAEGKSNFDIAGAIGVEFPTYDGDPVNAMDIAVLRAQRFADIKALETAKVLSFGEFRAVSNDVLATLKADGRVIVTYSTKHQRVKSAQG